MTKSLRKLVALLLCVCTALACFALTACGNKDPETGNNPGVTDTDKEKPDETGTTLTKYRQQTEIPTLEITTTYPINSKYDYVTATYKMVSESGEYDFEADGQIRLRGNYTRTLTKKPYRVKFTEKQSPLGMPKSKSWYLLNEATDFSMLRNYLGYTYADDLLDYSLRARYVQVKVNDDYKGIYLLTDKRGEDKNRVPVKLTEDANTGWIIEIDNRAIGGDVPGTTAYEYCQVEGIEFGVNAFHCDIPKVGMQAFVISEPEAPTSEQFKIIKDTVTASVNSLGGENYGTYFDLNAMARYYMVKELWHDTDVGSVYMYCETGADKIKLGPVWDLDLTCGISKVLDAVPGTTNSPDEWFYREINVLIKPIYNKTAFKNALKENWQATYDKETADMLKGIDEAKELLAPYQKKNFDRWGGISEGKVWSDDDENNSVLSVPFFFTDKYIGLGTWENHVADVKSFLTTRVTWMNTQINQM